MPAAIKREKLTDEQRKLIEDNLEDIKTWFYCHNVFDEDQKQDMLYNLCAQIHLYDSSKGTFSTFIDIVNSSRKIKLYYHDNAIFRTLNNIALRLDDVIYTDSNGVNYTIADTIGDYDVNLDKFEETDLCKYVMNKLKHCEQINKEDLKVFIAYVNTGNYGEVAKLFGVSRQRIQQRVVKVRNVIKSKGWMYH